MAAYQYTLSPVPTLIADGTKAAYIQEVQGSGTRFTQSDTSPDISSIPFCTIKNNDLSISSGYKLWAWSPDLNPITITVLTADF